MANEIQIYIGTFHLDNTTGVAIEDISVQINKTVNQYALPKYHGSIIPIGKRKDMSLKLSGSLTSTNYDALRTALDNLKAAFDDTVEKIFTTDDDRQVMVQYKSFSYAWKTLRTFLTFSVELVASDPFWYSQTLNSDSRTPTSTVGYTIANAGNAPTRVKLTLTNGATPIADAIKVQNTTTGESLQYRGTLAASKVLIVDNKVSSLDLAVTNDSVSDFPNFEGDFLTLAAGNNTIVFTGAVVPAVKVEWRDCYK